MCKLVFVAVMALSIPAFCTTGPEELICANYLVTPRGHPEAPPVLERQCVAHPSPDSIPTGGLVR